MLARVMGERLALDVDRFAELTADLDDPFGDPAQVLAEAGLDAVGYEALVATWRARFEGDATGELSTRFADVYEPRRLRPSRTRPPAERVRDAPSATTGRAVHTSGASSPFSAPVPVVSPPVLAPEEPLALSAPPAPPAIGVPIACLASTAGIGAFIPGMATPFSPAPASAGFPTPPAAPAQRRVESGTAAISAAVSTQLVPFPDPPSPPAAPLIPPAARRPNPLAATADIGDFFPRAVTPFSAAPPPPPPPPEAAPRRRLIRFDPQTGQPLPSPTWVDLPPEPGQNK
jgi:hypothetical protein